MIPNFAKRMVILEEENVILILKIETRINLLFGAEKI